MQTKKETEHLVIFLEGRIDAASAPALDKELSAALSENADRIPLFDAAGLDYISSAGLRLLLKVAKATKAEKKLTVRNLSKEVYDIFETTGFTSLFDVQKALREVSVEGCPVIGSGSYGNVYRLDDETIAKFYLPTISLETVRQEKATAQKAFLLGVPTAISYDVVKNGDCYGAVYELLQAKTVAQIMDEEPDRVWEMGVKSAELLRRLHGISVTDESFPDRKHDMLLWAEKMAPFLSQKEAESLRAFIAAIPEGNSFLHGDYHSKNIMVQGDEFLLIDIGDAARGNPIFDLAGLVLIYQNLPASPRTEEERYRLLGFHLEDAALMLRALFSTYFAIDSQNRAAIQAKVDEIVPYSELMWAYHHSRRANFEGEEMQEIRAVMEKKLFPRIR